MMESTMHFVRVFAISALVIGGFCVQAGSVLGDNCPTWPGPTRDSVGLETDLPLTWREGASNVRKTRLPEWGTSTPAIWGDAVFLTSEADGKLLLLKIDKQNGEIVWTREVG